MLIYLGRISKEKTLHLLAEAFNQLAHTHSVVHLAVAGDGPYLE